MELNNIKSHFTATGIVFNQEGQFLFHFHPKIGYWLPPGGHVEENEEPQNAVLREITEETGLQCECLCYQPELALNLINDDAVELVKPLAILKEPINDKKQGFHYHIDMIYLCRPLQHSKLTNNSFQWLTLTELKTKKTFENVIRLIELTEKLLKLNVIKLS
ncbi:NUDIX hydrolase [Proteus hauseri]|uniref:NUDIX hydrolase n=1 Tax=Proteus hauseri TaxID=183417 RepID=UPI0032DBDA94